MNDFLFSYQFLSVLGLILDIIAIIMMFYKPGEMTASGYSRKSRPEEWGIILLIIGFLFQLASSVLSYFV